MKNIEFTFRELLNFKLFTIGKADISVSSLIFLVIFILALNFIVKIIRKLIYRSQKLDESKKFTIFSLITLCPCYF